jgi:hypothetical protein
LRILTSEKKSEGMPLPSSLPEPIYGFGAEVGAAVAGAAVAGAAVAGAAVAGAAVAGAAVVAAAPQAESSMLAAINRLRTTNILRIIFSSQIIGNTDTKWVGNKLANWKFNHLLS